MNSLRPIGTIFTRVYYTYQKEVGEVNCYAHVNEKHFENVFKVVGYETDMYGRTYEALEEIKGYEQ